MKPVKGFDFAWFCSWSRTAVGVKSTGGKTTTNLILPSGVALDV